MSVERIGFAEATGWKFAEGNARFEHATGRFFTIEGLRVWSDAGTVPSWDQPIILQPEVGTLGILTSMVDGERRFLMQAKAEPGNINQYQVSPTLQATRSNYTRAHGGAEPEYLDFFAADKDGVCVRVDQLQPEQGARFLGKRNRNMVVEVDGLPQPGPLFRWFTLRELKALMRLDNILNMDARSVLACIPPNGFDGAGLASGSGGECLGGFRAALFDSAAHGSGQTTEADPPFMWLAAARARRSLTADRIPLTAMRDWELTPSEIRHVQRRHFSVVAVRVEAGNREVQRWAQPLVSPVETGLVGLVCAVRGEVLRFLVRATSEPGNTDGPLAGPTVMTGEPGRRTRDALAPPFLGVVLRALGPGKFGRVRYDTLQSEEGGRFFRMQTRYVIIEMDEHEWEPDDPPPDFAWFTLAEILALNQRGYCTIELRTLLASLDLT